MSAKRKTNTKRKTSRKSRKPKVYIPAGKIIVLCTLIIAFCAGLLLFTTNENPSKKTDKTEISKKISDQEEKIQPPANELKKEAEKSQKQETKKDSKTESVPQKPQTKPENKKTETKKSDNKTEEIKKEEVQKQEAQKQENVSQKKSYDFPSAQNSAQLIFVFDDGGQNLKQLQSFLSLPFPITVAVLPQISNSVEAADLVRKSGNEVILHQPMQSVNANVNPGPGAIRPDMSEDEIISTLFTNINQIGPVAGLNNHEGSAITADAEKMALVMKIASENGIYVLDSRTNVETKIPYVARELGYTYYERNIFLDNVKTVENALSELKKGLTIANKKGSVIMIGHIWSADFLPDFLQKVFPELKEKGYTFSTVSKSKALKE